MGGISPGEDHQDIGHVLRCAFRECDLLDPTHIYDGYDYLLLRL
jgi:hypothetical protein